MPIDSSSNPFGGGVDPDDLANAGKGVGIPDKGLEPLDDDDLDDAGKGSFDDGGDAEPFVPDGIEKGGAADELFGAADADDDVLGSKLDDADDDLFGTKGTLGDDDDPFDKLGDDDVDELDDVDAPAQDLDVDL